MYLLHIPQYYNQRNKIIDCFCNLISRTKFSILCYHFTRLTKEEIEDIKKSGLKIYDEFSIKEKIEKLYVNRYITYDEKITLINNNLLNTQKSRENQIHFDLGFLDISYQENNKNDIFRLLDCYGGEIISMSNQECKDISKKMWNKSFPCVVVFLIESDLLNYSQYKKIAEKIIYNYPNLNRCLMQMFIDQDCKNILDIIKVNEKSKLI